MLVLSRKLNQEIVIDGNITVQILKVKGNTVRLGISAPKDVHIVRGELPSKEEEFGSDFSETTIEKETSEPEGIANVTVVFSGEEESRIDLLPFNPAESQSSDSKSRFENENRLENRSGSSNSADESIKFRSKLPTALHRNRLAEIASQVSNMRK